MDYLFYCCNLILQCAYFFDFNTYFLVMCIFLRSKYNRITKTKRFRLLFKTKKPQP